MTETKSEEIHRNYSLIRVFVILILLFGIVTSVAAAQSQTINLYGTYMNTLTIPSPIEENTQFPLTLTTTSSFTGTLYAWFDDANYNRLFYKQTPISGTTATIYSDPLPAGTYGVFLQLADSNGFAKDTTHQQITVVKGTSNSIPEFPSVAVPVAAILGLIVIFGRRKTNLE